MGTANWTRPIFTHSMVSHSHGPFIEAGRERQENSKRKLTVSFYSLADTVVSTEILFRVHFLVSDGLLSA